MNIFSTLLLASYLGTFSAYPLVTIIQNEVLQNIKPTAPKYEAKIAGVNAKYCVRSEWSLSGNGKGAKTKRLELSVTFHLTLRNLDATPLIISRDSVRIVRHILYAKKSIGSPGNSISVGYVNELPLAFTPDIELPEEPLFVALKQGQSEEFPLQSTHILSPKLLETLKNGAFVQYQIISWRGREKLGSDLANKWKNFGNLFLEDIVPEPVAFELELNDLSEGCKK